MLGLNESSWQTYHAAVSPENTIALQTRVIVLTLLGVVFISVLSVILRLLRVDIVPLK